MEIKEFRKKPINKLPPEKAEELVKKARKEYDVLVKGMFEFLDAQGGWIEFTERVFKDQPILTIRINHGEICELPMGIVKRLNNTYKKIRKFDNVELKGQGFRGMPQSYDIQSRVRFTPINVL